MAKRYRQSRFNATIQDQERINLVAAYFKLKPGKFMKRVIMDAVKKAEDRLNIRINSEKLPS